MKKILYILLGLTLGSAGIVYAATPITFPINGGTGIGTKPTYGQVLVGNTGGTYNLMSTSSLNIAGGSGTNYFTNASTNTYLNTGSNLEAPTLTATSTTGTSTIVNAVTLGNGSANGAGYLNIQGNNAAPAYGYIPEDVIDAGGNANDGFLINTYNNMSGACAQSGFYANGDIPILNGDFSAFMNTNSGWVGGVGCNGNVFSPANIKPLSTYIYQPTGDLDIVTGSTTNFWDPSTPLGVKFYTGGTNNLTEIITNQGRVGIGTSTPAYPLDIEKLVSPIGLLGIGLNDPVHSGILFGEAQTANTPAMWFGSNAINPTFANTGFVYNNNNSPQFNSAPGGAINFTINGQISQSMILNSSGNLQIGNNLFDSKNVAQLNVEGSGYIESSLAVGTTSTTTAVVLLQASTTVPSLKVASSTNTQFIVDTNGNMGLGTTTPGTLLSLGTSTSYINLSNYATSTFSKGINLTSGCFAIGNTCISGSSLPTFSPSSVITSDSSGNLIATGTQLTVGTILATTTGNSIFKGTLSVATTTNQTKETVDGTLRVTGSGPDPTTGGGFEISYSGSGGSQFLSFDRSNSLYKPLIFNGSPVQFLVNGNSTPAIYAANNNLIGINTATPATTLDVNGTIRAINEIDPTSGSGLEMYNGGLIAFNRSASSWQPILIRGSTLTFGVNGNATNAITIPTSGNIGIASSSPVGLTVITTAASSTPNLIIDDTTNGGCIIMRDAGIGHGYTELYTVAGVLLSKVTTSITTCN